MVFPKFLFCPAIENIQMNGKQAIFRYLLYVVYIAGILFFAAFMSMRLSAPSMIDSFDSREEQHRKIKKLKPLAYVVAEKFTKNNLKVSPSAKFARYKESSVVWRKGNKFICNVEVNSRNTSGILIFSKFILEAEYVGDNKWYIQKINKSE